MQTAADAGARFHTTACHHATPLRVERFDPLLVERDLAGNSLFETSNKAINARTEAACVGLKKPALSRHGETDEKTRELI